VLEQQAELYFFL